MARPQDSSQCGNGLISFEAAKKAQQVYATDISSKMIERCKLKQRNIKINNIEFTQADSYSLSFEDNIADKLICCNALHVVSDPSSALDEYRNSFMFLPWKS